VGEVASRWDQLLRFCALRLGRELGADVQVVIPRKEAADPASRLSRFVSELAGPGTLSGTVRIPDAVGDLELRCDIRAGTVSVSIELTAPQEGRLPTRVNWLVRQLKEAPGQLRVDGLLAGSKTSTSELLSTLRENPDTLVDAQKREFRAFRVTAVSTLGPKRGTGRGAFIDSVLTGVDGFYECVVQALRPWTAKAPQLPKSGRSAAEEAGIDTTTPPEDLQDEVSEDVVTPPDESIRPDLIAVPASDASESEPSMAEMDPEPARTAQPMVEWDGASVRLEREREHTPAVED